MNQDKYSSSAKVGQTAIAMFAPIAVDGKWGNYTNTVYAGLSSANRATVDQVLKAVGTSASELSSFRTSEKQGALRLAVNYNGTVDAAIEQAAAHSGVELKALRGFAKIESNFNPTAVNGSSRGLMQMQPGAWSDAAKTDPAVKGYDQVFDPLQNALAGAAYYKLNLRAIARIPGFTGPIEPAMVYMAHQQGAGGFAELWNAAHGRKTTNYVTAKSMTGNPPQDGKGVTTNKADFYNRWIAVARAKMI